MGDFGRVAPMRTAVDRLRFAIDFAETNLDHFRAWEWSKLRADIEGFLYGVKGQPMPQFGALVISQALEPPFPADCPEDKLRELQSDVRSFLRGIAPGPGIESEGGPPFTISQEWQPMLMGGQHLVLRASASLRDAVLFLLALLLAHNGLQNMRRCPATGCGRLFWKVRRQLYCSRTCVNRENMRTWTRRKREQAGHRAATKGPRTTRGRKKGGKS